MKANWKYWSLKGNSLVYSLMISMLVSTLLSAYLMADFSFRSLAERVYTEISVQDNLRSTVALALAHTEKFKDFSWYEEQDSAWVSFENWGGFKLSHIKASHQHQKGQMSVLLGQKLGKNKVGLALSDEGYPLTLKGNTQLKGEVLVPKGKIYTERSNGQNFRGNIPSVEKIKPSRRLSQRDFPDIPKEIKAILDSLQALREGYLERPALIIEEDLKQGWREPIMKIRTRGKLYIKGGKYQGKIMLMATESIEIGANASLEDVILIAPSIKMQNGVQGRFQVFAGDSLLLGDDVQLQFPSMLALSAKPDRPAILEIKRRCRIEGAVLFYQAIGSSSSSNLRPQLIVGEGSAIYGTLHCAGNLSLHGVVGGMVIAKGFVLRTAVGTVRNHLLNAQLWEDRLAPAYAGPFLFDEAETAVLKIYHPGNEKVEARGEQFD